MAFANPIPVTVAVGTPFPVPQGASFISVFPSTGASFTYTNNIGSGMTSAAISVPFSFPSLGSNTWDVLTITAIVGPVYITYVLT